MTHGKGFCKCPMHNGPRGKIKSRHGPGVCKCPRHEQRPGKLAADASQLPRSQVGY